MSSPSKSIVPLILATLTLSLGAVALIINGALTMPTVQDISTSCSEAVRSTAALSSCQPSTNLEETLQQVVPPSVNHPGFAYPKIWNIAHVDIATATGNIHTLVADTGIATYCTSCQRNATLIITTQALPPTYIPEGADIFVSQQYTYSEDAIITKEQVSLHGTEYQSYHITGITPTSPPQSFADILFLGTSSWSQVMITSTETFTPTPQTIQDITHSLDFSLIQ